MPKLSERVYKRETGDKVSYSVTIPIDLVRALNWKKGDDLVLSKNGEKIVIEKIKHF